MASKKRNMNKEIKKWPIFGLSVHGVLFEIHAIKSTDDYNHFTHHLHHFIPDYENKQDWYDERGIKQKLILVTIPLHEQIHLIAVHNLTDEEFLERCKISRWELIFNRKHSEY